VEAGRLSLQLTLKLNYLPFMKSYRFGLLGFETTDGVENDKKILSEDQILILELRHFSKI